MLKSIQIKNSYNIWSPTKMKIKIQIEVRDCYMSWEPTGILNRTYVSMYIEWWLHNIGYYITKPFVRFEKVKKINLRCKDIDLEEWK